MCELVEKVCPSKAGALAVEAGALVFGDNAIRPGTDDQRQVIRRADETRRGADECRG